MGVGGGVGGVDREEGGRGVGDGWVYVGVADCVFGVCMG